MDPILEQLKSYFENTPREIVERDWSALSAYANVGPSIPEFFASLDVKPKEWEYNMQKNNNVTITETPKYNSEFFCI